MSILNSLDLNIIWFLLIAILFAGFFFLEGFDYGAGAVLPLVGRDDDERRLVLNTFGPVWDGNEVWLLTAGGAIFAAFPHWYATMFSGFYLALFLILVALILRIVAIEYRSKMPSPRWRGTWDIILGVASALPAFLWGVAVTNLVTGVPIDANMEFAGNFLNLISPFDILGGVCFLMLFCYHGCLFILLKTSSQALRIRCNRYAKIFFGIMLATLLGWLVCAFFFSNMFKSVLALALTGVAAVGLVVSIVAHVLGRQGIAFIGTGVGIVTFTFAVFAGMYPNVMISTLNPEWSLTIYNASSSPYTLRVMTIVAVTLVPVVLAYQIWSYWVFRKRISEKDVKHMEY